MENNNYSKNRKRLIFSLLFFLSFIASFSQTTIRGIVRDAATQQPLQSVSIYFKGGKGITSAADGSYSLIDGSNKSKVVNYSYVGYKSVSKTVVPNVEQSIEVALEVAEGNKVTVKTNKRGKYSNKNNPGG
ncbi:MAG: carboxypeptidase-like regulatory domain-containing protein [Segetibacter sp.]